MSDTRPRSAWQPELRSRGSTAKVGQGKKVGKVSEKRHEQLRTRENPCTRMRKESEEEKERRGQNRRRRGQARRAGQAGRGPNKFWTGVVSSPSAWMQALLVRRRCRVCADGRGSRPGVPQVHNSVCIGRFPGSGTFGKCDDPLAECQCPWGPPAACLQVLLPEVLLHRALQAPAFPRALGLGSLTASPASNTYSYFLLSYFFLQVFVVVVVVEETGSFVLWSFS